MKDYTSFDFKDLSDWFVKFADTECKLNYPLYYALCKSIAKDKLLIEIAAKCTYRQPMPNLFLAAVHYLLIKNPSQELASYYPTISKKKVEVIPFDLFQQFCVKYKNEIEVIVSSKIVQTNALNRTAYLMPIINSLFEGKTVNLIDIGTSAGLTLNLDKYSYNFDNSNNENNSDEVVIKSDFLGTTPPKYSSSASIARKIGIDQNPIDITIEENANWLKALIWADAIDRFNRIENAIKLVDDKIEFFEADSISQFEEIINSIPPKENLFLYHTHVLYQFPKESRAQFWDLMDKIGQERDFTYLAVEGSKVFRNTYNTKGVLIELNQYENGKKKSKIIAETDGHARQVKWL